MLPPGILKLNNKYYPLDEAKLKKEVEP